MLNFHFLTHVNFEGPAYIKDWAISKGHNISITKLYENTDLPEINTFDWLIIMGGPMSINEEEKYPWLIEEKIFIRNAINRGKVVIGVCLGAQLIADVLGAKVYKNEYKEIGWFPVYITDEAKNSPLFKSFPEELTVFHWHGETFDIPEGAIHLFESKACRNQAFLYKEKVLGLQFHFEMTETSVTEMINNCGAEIINDKYVQPADVIKNKLDLTIDCKRKLAELLEKIEELF